MENLTITKDIKCHGGFNIPFGSVKQSLGKGYDAETKRDFHLVESNVVKNGFVLPIAVYENEYIVN